MSDRSDYKACVSISAAEEQRRRKVLQYDYSLVLRGLFL